MPGMRRTAYPTYLFVAIRQCHERDALTVQQARVRALTRMHRFGQESPKLRLNRVALDSQRREEDTAVGVSQFEAR
jgi:hypothetical protein